MKKFYETSGLREGFLTESSILGLPDKTKKYQLNPEERKMWDDYDKEKKKIQEERGIAKAQGIPEKDWLRYKFIRPEDKEKWFGIIKKVQAWNPANPKPKVVNEAIVKINNYLDGLFEKEKIGIGEITPEYYSTIGTALDDIGIDGFMEIGNVRITIDATINRKGKPIEKADIILEPKKELTDKQAEEDLAVELYFKAREILEKEKYKIIKLARKAG